MQQPLSITSHHVNNLWVELLTRLLTFGDEIAPRGQLTRERLAVTLHLTDPLANIITIPERKLNYSFMVAEWLWIMAGRDDVPGVAYYNPNIVQFSDDGARFFGAYGPKVAGQLPYVLDALTRDPSTRQAVLTIWRESPRATRDVPCTVAMQFLIRENALHLIVTMRSSDAWLGIPYDIYNFTRLQAAVAAELRATATRPELATLRLGTFTLQLGSSHLYQPHFAQAVAISDTYRLDRDLRPLNAIGRSTELSAPVPRGDWLTAAEEVARLRGEVNLRFAEDYPRWVPYLEVLAYRTHKDLTRGDGYLMRLLRAMRQLQTQEVNHAAGR